MKYQQPHRALNTSTIRSAAYDEHRQILEIAFRDGMLRSYRCLPADVARRFFATQNPASFWEDRIAEEYPMIQTRMETLPPLMEGHPNSNAALQQLNQLFRSPKDS
ncbi:MAG: KTSC domain-containing protein [Lautropia sp.]|nr:KTSC domain-containing protein [Lautropia sp.]